MVSSMSMLMMRSSEVLAGPSTSVTLRPVERRDPVGRLRASSIVVFGASR